MTGLIMTAETLIYSDISLVCAAVVGKKGHKDKSKCMCEPMRFSTA